MGGSLLEEVLTSTAGTDHYGNRTINPGRKLSDHGGFDVEEGSVAYTVPEKIECNECVPTPLIPRSCSTFVMRAQ